MRVRRTVRFIIIWFLVIILVLSVRVITEIKTSDDDFKEAYSAYGITALVENDIRFQVIDLMNDQGLMSSIKSWTINRNISFEQITIDSDYNLYVLISYTDEETGIIMYDIVSYDTTAKPNAESGWFILNWNGPVSDMEVYEGVLYIAQIGADDLVYEYDQQIDELVDTTGYKTIPDVDVPSTFYASKTYKPDSGKSVKDVYVYEDTVKIITTDSAEENPDTLTLNESKALRDTIAFTPSYIIRKFIIEYLSALFVFILGIVLYFAVPKILAERNRLLAMLIVWEFALAILLLCFWFGYTQMFKNVSLLVMFAIGTLIGFLLLYLESVDLRLLTQAVVGLAERDVVPERPEVYGKDIRYIWNGLIEIGNKVDRLNHTKQVIFDTLSRYVPMGVNYMSEEVAVTDLKTGDFKEGYLPVAVVGGRFLRENRLDGSLMVDDNSMATHFMKFIAKYQSFKKAVLLGMNSDMSVSEFLFTGDIRTLHTFGLDFHSMVGKYMPKGDNFKTVIVIHYCDLKYGVIGTSSVMHQFLFSNEMREIEENFDFLKELGVDFVISKEAMDQEKDKPCARYIGALELPSRLTPFEMYQILDNMSQSEKHLYLDNLDSFNKGISLMKEKNFYLARNTFAEVLHNVPTDGVARYYLYLCEKNLDLPSEEVSILLNK